MKNNYKNFTGTVRGPYLIIEDNGDLLLASCIKCKDIKNIDRYSKPLKYCKACEKSTIVPLDVSSLNLEQFHNCEIIGEADTFNLSLSKKKVIVKCNCCNGEEIINYTSFNTRTTPYLCKKIRDKHTKLSKIRVGIIKRCYQENHKSYKNYGARGITMCDEWRYDPKSFITWAMANGYELNLDIDRTYNDGNYCPDNCRFITQLENARNKSTNSLTEALVIQLKTTDWGDKNYREITEAIGLDGIKNVAGVWAVLNGKTWTDIK